MCPIFAKTVQCVRSYQVYKGRNVAIDITPQIQNMIDYGWKVISITSITQSVGTANPTDYVIVLYEKEEE